MKRPVHYPKIIIHRLGGPATFPRPRRTIRQWFRWISLAILIVGVSTQLVKNRDLSDDRPASQKSTAQPGSLTGSARALQGSLALNSLSSQSLVPVR